MTIKHLQPKIPGRGDMPSTDRYIGQADMTPWEHRWQEACPTNSYAIRADWDETERDFIAYWKLRTQKLIGEFGRHDIKPVIAINRWLGPILRGDVDPSSAPDEHWLEHAKASWEATPPAERPKAEVRSTRKHVDGRILSERGETVGRWDDNERGVREWAVAKGLDPDTEVERRLKAPERPATTGNPLLDQVLTWAAEQPGTDHEDRWLRAAAGMGLDNGYAPMTSSEASEHSVRFWAKRWDPVARAIRDKEMGFTGGGQSVDAQLEEALTVINERSDVEVRKYNPETNTLDVLSPVDAAYKAEQDAYAEEVQRFQAARDAGEPEAQQGFDEWRRLQSPNGALFPFNGIYVEDARTGCFIPSDYVARNRKRLANIRYRLDTDRPDGMRQLTWLADVDGERDGEAQGFLADLPENAEKNTRMVPAKEVPDLIWAAWRILTHKEYSKNQRVMGARDDKFTAFKLWVQHSPDDKPLGICPTQGDSSLDGGVWKHNADLFARLHGHAVEEIAPVDAPVGIANAIQAGDWAEVARLAQERC